MRYFGKITYLINYLRSEKRKAKLMGFVRKNNEVKEIMTAIITKMYYMILKELLARFIKNINHKLCKHSKSIDLEPLFVHSVADKSLMQNGTKLATSAAAIASDALKIQV